MIGEVLVLLRDLLNTHVRAPEAEEPKVVLVDGDGVDAVQFKPESVTALLVNLEEEKTLRKAQPFRRNLADGTALKVFPELRLNLYVLFVARFKEYEVGLKHLSLIIQYFQGHRVLDHQSAPGLSEGIAQLTLELVTLPFSQQNEIWNALRTAYHPSVLYRVGLVTFQDNDGIMVPEITETELVAR